jgi:hypothetical protein
MSLHIPRLDALKLMHVISALILKWLLCPNIYLSWSFDSLLIIYCLQALQNSIAFNQIGFQ